MTTDTTITDTSTEDTSGLKNKNADLVRRLKLAEQRAEEAEQAREAAAEEAERQSGNLEALEKRLEAKWQKKYDALAAERDALSGDLRTIRLDNEVKSAIAAGNVRPELVPAVEALLLRQAQYDDSTKQANINGAAIGDYAKEFFGSKEGSFYVNAPASSGVGSTGSTPAKPQRMTKETFNATEYLNIKKENPDLARELATEMGMTHLLG
jgi:hypothetical protein